MNGNNRFVDGYQSVDILYTLCPENVREGAKFIGPHPWHSDGGAKSFSERKNDGANTFPGEKNDGAETF